MRDNFQDKTLFYYVWRVFVKLKTKNCGIWRGTGQQQSHSIVSKWKILCSHRSLLIIGAFTLQSILKFQDLAQYKIGNILKYSIILLGSLVREQVESHTLQKTVFAQIPASISFPVFSILLPWDVLGSITAGCLKLFRAVRYGVISFQMDFSLEIKYKKML